MDSSSIAELLRQIELEMGTIRWHFMNSDFFSITYEQLRIVRRYALELSVDSNFSLRMHQNWSHNEVWERRDELENRQIVCDMVLCFLRDDMKELFDLPKSSHFAQQNILKKNELLAVFFGFLVDLLNHGDKDSAFMDNSQALMVGLRSLVAILGDTPFQVTEHPQLQSILAKFEDIANEAGSVVHSALLSPDLVLKTVDGAIAALLQHIDSLRGIMIDLLNLLPNIVVTREMNSFFIVHSLVYDLEELLNQDLNLPFDVKDLIGMLHGWLKPFQSLIKEVELPKVSKYEGFEEVMAQIGYVAYDAEYLIKSFLVEDVPHWYLTIRLTHLMEKLKNIRVEPWKLKNDYDVGALSFAEVSTAELSQQLQSDPDVVATDSDIVSVFENQEKDILDQLLGGKDERKSIFVVGMAGVGKTTLAKQLYNHPSIGLHFDKMVWCAVSQTPHWRNLFIRILSCLDNEMDKANILKMDEETLTLKVYQCLKFRRFMIVVDDIWQPDHWQYLERFLPNDQNGSRILLTSRNANVAKSCSIIHLLPWSDDQCLQLLLNKKVIRNYKPGTSHLEEMGKRIAAKCFGLPLVAVVMAGILLDKEESSLKIMNDDSIHCCEHFDESVSIMRVLELSYTSLPAYLKPCFLYFGMFEEDEEISVKKLKQHWIAEGFIPKEENERAEQIAEKYLKELIDKNLVIVTRKRSDGGIKFCAIHDLLRDLCLKIAEKENFLASTCNKYSMDKQTCDRLCFSNPGEHISFVAPFCSRCRSLFVNTSSNRLHLSNVKLLRALEYRSSSGGYPDLYGIELLFHLKYLAVETLPWQNFLYRIRWLDFIPNIANLEFLTVQCPIVLTPKIMEMLRLRYLCSPKIECGRNCETIKTSNLEFLCTLKICKKEDEEMLRSLRHLGRLKCEYFWSFEEKTGPSLDFHSLAKCESLTVKIIHIPEIIEIKLPSNVRKLNLYGLCLPWEKMSMIAALPNLQVLKLGYNTFVGEIWNTEDDEYRQLKYLKMETLLFSQWVIGTSSQFPTLQHLVLKKCPNLKEIPTEIGDIAALRVIKLQGRCRSSLVESATDIEEDQREFGNDEIKFIFSDIECW